MKVTRAIGPRRTGTRGFLLLVLVLLLPFGAHSKASAQLSTEARLRDLVEKFFDAYCKENLDGIRSVWSSRSAEWEGAAQNFKETFAGKDRIELKSLTIQKTGIDGDAASIRLIAEINAVESKTGKPAKGFGWINRTFRFVREGGDWRIADYLVSEEGLAAALVESKTEGERNALLEAEKDLVTPDLVQSLIARGRDMVGQAEYRRAVTLYKLALDIGARIGDKSGIAKALNGLGTAFYRQGDFVGALAQHQKSLKLAEELNDTAQIASCTTNIGIIYDSQGDYARALEHYQKSLRLHQQLDNKAGVARALNNLGIVHRMQGNIEQALDYMHKSLKLKQEIGDPIEISTAFSNLGEVYTARGSYAEAADYLQKSLKLSESEHDKVGLAQTLGNLGILAGLQGDHERALDYLKKNLELNEAMGDKAGIATTLNNLGETHLARGEFVKAAELGDRAASLAREIEFGEMRWVANTTAGRAYRALNQDDHASRSFTEAINAIEELRSQVGGGEQDQQRFLETRLSPYYGMVDLLVAQGNSVDALLYAERAKGRVLLDVLRSGRIDITKAMTGDETEREHKLRAEAVSLNLQLHQENLEQQADAKLILELKSRLQKARLEYESFQTGLYAAHPELKVRRGRMAPLTFDRIDRLVSDAETALVEFAVMENKIFLFVLTGGAAGDHKSELSVYTAPVKRNELAELTKRFGKALAERRLNVNDLSARIYDLLLNPVKARLNGVKNLIIVPDDVLWQLPFQALKPSGGRYLIEDYTLSYAPSLTVLGEMMNRRPKPEAGPRAFPTLLAFGNPAVGTEARASAKSALMDDRLEPLPEAEKQVKLLGRLYGPAQSRIYVGPRAQEERFKAEAGSFRILHLATHGILNDASPMYSQLVLAESKSREDGLLEAWEIMKMDLKADLVVLSACETARGRVGAGEGIIGLSWALFVAGAPAAIVSQWKVDSASTTSLMVEFHRLMRGSSRPGESRLGSAAALRLATLKLLKSGPYSHPFYWAPFVVIGDGLR